MPRRRHYAAIFLPKTPPRYADAMRTATSRADAAAPRATRCCAPPRLPPLIFGHMLPKLMKPPWLISSRHIAMWPPAADAALLPMPAAASRDARVAFAAALPPARYACRMPPLPLMMPFRPPFSPPHAAERRLLLAAFARSLLPACPVAADAASHAQRRRRCAALLCDYAEADMPLRYARL
jgi:hypothetical protein